MTQKEFEKKIDATRRTVCKKYGFRQSSYINFKVEQGYFFELCFYSTAILTVKPMYADELWWDIFDLEDNKKAPVSLRGLGCYSLSGQTLCEIPIYERIEDRNSVDVGAAVERAFVEASAEIRKFLNINPDAEAYIPEESSLGDPDKLLRLVALIHHGRDEEVLEFIDSARKQGHTPVDITMCVDSSGAIYDEYDSYEAIERWCKRGKQIPELWDVFKGCLAKLSILWLFVAASCSSGAGSGASSDSDADSEVAVRRHERAEALRRDSIREDSLRRAAELMASDPLHAYEFVSGVYYKPLDRKNYSFFIDQTVMKRKGFVKSGNQSWERKGADGITKVKEQGEDIEREITITFPTSAALKAFVHTFPAAGLQRSEYDGSGNVYVTGGFDSDIVATVSGLTVTLSY